jgi:hypothetical protein
MRLGNILNEKAHFISYMGAIGILFSFYDKGIIKVAIISLWWD